MPNVLKFKNEAKNPFSIHCSSETDAEIILYGAIGDSWYDESAVSAKQFSDSLAALPKTVKNIKLRINSPGGSVFDGITIYERLKQHSAKKTVYIDGIAASIASVIAMAGDEIIIGEGSFVMIHKPLTMTWGNADNHEDTIRILDKIENQMVSIYAKKTGLSTNEISNMLPGEGTWMTAEEALKNGFATSIAGSSENLQVAASMVSSAKWLAKTCPPKIEDTKRIKLQIEAVQKKLNGFLNKK